MILAMETVITLERCGEERGLELISKAGFDGVDYSFFGEEKDCRWRLDERYMERAKVTSALLEQYGLACNQAHAPFLFRYEYGPWENTELWTEIIRSMEYAACLGAKQIIIHPVDVPEGVDYVDYNTRYLGSFAAAAERFGIRIAIENGPPSDVINELLERLDSPYYVCCVDVGHCNEPARNYHPQNMLAEIAPGKLQALHLHDNKGMVGRIGDDHNLPGLGVMDWDAMLRVLADRGYPGDVTLEIVGYMRNLPEEVYPEALALAHAVGRRLMKKLLAMK